MTLSRRALTAKRKSLRKCTESSSSVMMEKVFIFYPPLGNCRNASKVYGQEKTDEYMEIQANDIMCGVTKKTRPINLYPRVQRIIFSKSMVS